MSEEATNPESPKKTTRTRSPNYPMMPLNEAISRVKQVYDREHTHKASPVVVADALGYGGLNGTSRMIISTLRKYGLIQNDGDSVRVSPLAVDIIELPHDDPHWSEAITKAAFMPPLFQELHDTFGANLPSDANLRHYLIKKGYNPKMVTEIIQVYKDTTNLVDAEESGDTGGEDTLNPEGEDTLNPDVQGQQEQNMQANTATQSPPPPVRQGAVVPPMSRVTPTQQQFLASIGNVMPIGGANASDAFSEALRYRISGNSRAHVYFEGTVTQEAIRKLIAHLELSLDDFPSNQDLFVLPNTQQTGLEAPKIGPAVWKQKDADLPVVITGEAGERDGQKFLWAESSDGGKTGIPADEVEF